MRQKFQCLQDVRKKPEKEQLKVFQETIQRLKRIVATIQNVLMDKNSFVKDYNAFAEKTKKITSNVDSAAIDNNDENVKKRVMYFVKGYRENNSIENKTYNGFDGNGILLFQNYINVLRCSSRSNFSRR